MTDKSFQAMVVEQQGENQFSRHIATRSIESLPIGEVLIRVHYSSLNYKDALSASGNKGVTKSYPHTPGIDAAGVVEASSDPRFKPGANVLVTGYDLGMNTSGGFGQYVRVPADWVVNLPKPLTLKQSMIYGTAGFTAGISVLRICRHGITPDKGEVLVTGATGGVGSLAVALLANLGFQVTAASGKSDQVDFLKTLGARTVIPRQEVLDSDRRPLLKGRWAAVVDTVGGPVLAAVLKSTFQRAAVTCCGNVADFKLNTTVFPFILRGVSLYGIDSANCPRPERLEVWQNLAHDWKIEHFEHLATTVGIAELGHHMDLILEGRQRGRVVVDLLA